MGEGEARWRGFGGNWDHLGGYLESNLNHFGPNRVNLMNLGSNGVNLTNLGHFVDVTTKSHYYYIQSSAAAPTTFHHVPAWVRDCMICYRDRVSKGWAKRD